jgi:competence protein ComEC
LVAALPGAVGRVPAIPVQAFVLVVAGGLWWAVWRRPWRLLGVVPIALGVALAPTGRRPDVLIGRNAALVAVRDADGRLSALADRGGNFELTRWLEHDGDGRPPAEAARGTAFRCDGQGCTAEVRGLTVAIANTPASLRDDCARAAILVLRFAKPRTCAGPRAVIDPQDVAAMGAHALYIDADGVRVATLAEERGARPWAARGPEEPGDGPAVAERAR